MGSVNKAILVGNLGRDAEMRFTTGGTAVASVSIATTDHFTDRDGQKREDTQWHRIVIWGKTAESIQPYLTKGKQIYVEGKIQTREWTDKEGKQAKTTEIRAGGCRRRWRRGRHARRHGPHRRPERRRHSVLTPNSENWNRQSSSTHR
jgi:single stranded DNA-binding protein